MNHNLRVLIPGAICLAVSYRLSQLPNAQRRARQRLAAYQPTVYKADHGDIAYTDEGVGTPVLVSHGLFGGFDQGTDAGREHFPDNCRIISPSRFGYPGSAVKGQGTPREQAGVFVDLLDHLGIEQAYIAGFSAGGTAAICTALAFPERVKGLILWSSAPVRPKAPKHEPAMSGVPSLVNHDWFWWLLAPIFPMVSGLPSATIETMLPITPRRRGIAVDTYVTNPDMGRHFDAYPVEQLEIPVLLIHAMDDKIAPFTRTQQSMHRYANLTTRFFLTGGHMQQGNAPAIKQTIQRWIERNNV
ncbi:alpha/beta hydrolase [Stomatohabitans albus]|uniref:alpha/beta fold hydrolase n=1 Tax=Stomatohabitans albus TaxID=3110766 RepID=UPI00300D56C6